MRSAVGPSLVVALLLQGAPFFLAAQVGRASPPAASAGLMLEVTAGREPAADCIVEKELALADAARLLGQSEALDTGRVRVVEIGASGEVIAGPLAYQVDPAETPGRHVLCWQIPGTLAPERSRRFQILFDGKGEPPRPSSPLSTQPKGDDLAVTSGDVEITFSKAAGGMPARVRVKGVESPLSWRDKAFDGKAQFSLADHSAQEVRLLASGPLRFAWRATAEYGSGGQKADSLPRATYRFTQYAGEPLLRVDAEFAQNVAKSWSSLHFIEIHFDPQRFKSYATDVASGPLEQSGNGAPGQRWAAVFGDALLLGACGGGSLYVYDGGGRHYGAYLRSDVTPWSALTLAKNCSLFFGSGPGDLENLKKWSHVAANRPTVSVRFERLETAIEDLAALLDKKEQSAVELQGKSWAAGFFGASLARGTIEEARNSLAAGSFGAAAARLEQARKALDAPAQVRDFREANGVLSGLVDGHPFLANQQATYLWDRPDKGCGLIGIHDRAKRRDVVRVPRGGTPLWQMTTRVAGAADQGHDSATRGCRATPTSGGMDLVWGGEPPVRVRATLAPGESLVRMRLKAGGAASGPGILNVRFPVVNGILPISAGGARDMILDTYKLGGLKPSPLASGQSSQIHYPAGMQFGALFADGAGLYIAEEDPDANEKTLAWNADSQAGALSFDIAHPVLGWGGPNPAKNYASPGDVVIGPFAGDWYDAARLYRTWALTAPWCAQGPIHQRQDYPRWLAEAPYWTISALSSEHGIQEEIDKHDFYGVPTMISHAYGYYFPQTMDDRFPEWGPPRLGVAGFTQAVKQLQAKGIRVVPYINGWVWDKDSESYRQKDARNRAAQWRSADGGLSVMDSYGGGNSFVAMCPASRLWRDEMKSWTTDLVGRHGVDGVYFDFLTIHTGDCHNPAHGHPIGGGNYWTRAVHGLYEECRAAGRKLNPEFMMTGEDPAEYCIDVHDTFLSMGQGGTAAPLFLAVYHGYANVFGCLKESNLKAIELGRPWLLGYQNGWHNWEGAPMYGKPPYEAFAFLGQYYKRLLECRWKFANPYLGWGEMLRPPQVAGDLPAIDERDTYGPFTVAAVEGSAWKAPDGSVGLFFLNYDEKKTHTFTWTADLAEAGIAASEKVRVSRWTPDGGLEPLAELAGGVASHTMEARPLDIIALKLEVIR